jgi:hypothetical protein
MVMATSTTPSAGSPAEARAIVDANAYMTLATADAAGTPWASPVWFAPHAFTRFLWISRPEARHSRNIAARPEVGIVVFDSTVPIGGAAAVYVEATAGLAARTELDDLVAVYSRRSQAQGGEALARQEVEGDAPHRLYVARASAHFLLGPGDRRLPVRLAGG